MIERRLRQVFSEAGCEGSVAALDVDSENRVMFGDAEPMVAASTFKIVVALELFCQGAEGMLDPTERVLLSPARATPGGQGFCIFEDVAEVSLRDAARMMLTISDNTATDLLIRRVSLSRVHDRLGRLGLDRIRLAGTIQQEFDAIGRDTGHAGWADMARAMSESASPADADRIWERALTSPSLRPGRITSATAGQMAALLQLIWLDRAGPAAACRAVRTLLGQQRLTRKIATGFGGEVRVAAKSGTLPGCASNDVGVVEYPDGSRFAVAVFTRPGRPARPGRRTLPPDSVLGAAARLAVEHLHRRRPSP
ncbi:serine hydrolase [Streptomyces collinus]|uniref:Beta-lactamase n=1 Tax=Streptomyces collinus (strain DSM 40733 / Tue 365) TaxID=1214242 RepID=S5UW73_STRC3|nr:serine hydrolase [Streptomyces collinus]AGS67289.1 beta-lactamase [Streptomyces collinus Tu 365]AGS73406.1 beta-lactamase [Streptomyces collinus Tu 365]